MAIKSWSTADWVRAAVRLIELDKQLPAIRKGDREPASAAEYAEFGQLCVYKGSYADSAAFYRQAFTLDPKLADDLPQGHRYQAARAAAMAGSGHDAENGKLDAAARARWRKQARDWLSADLVLRRKQLGQGGPGDRQAVLFALNHMRTHNHLAGIRDKTSIARLPAHEQTELKKFWGDVEALRQQARRRVKE
jgi:serine/threonine-protein kinase